MKKIEHKQRELERISREIQRLSHGNPQQQRKCVRLKEDYEKVKEEIRNLQEKQKKEKERLDELRKKIEAIDWNDASKKRKRRKLEMQYEELRKSLGVGDELKDGATNPNDSSESGSLKASEKNDDIYLDEQHPEIKPVQKDQYGIYEQVRVAEAVEKRMQRRKKIESEAEDAFTIRIANLCELEADIGNAMKQMADPNIQKYEEELKLIRRKCAKDIKMLKLEIAKLERRINKINGTREICAAAMAEMNLTTKRMLFDMIGYGVSILRNTLYITARIRDSIVHYTQST